MSENECRTANWDLTGYRDGARGVSETYIGSRAEACAEFAVEVDRDAYMAGYERGLASYCQPANAVELAFSGGTYSGVCPPGAHGEFVRVFGAAQRVQEIRSRFGYLNEQARQLEHQMDNAATDEERRALRYQLSRVDEDMRVLRERLYYAEENLRQVMNGGTNWP